MKYTTQLDAARKGIMTLQMDRVASYENIDKTILMKGIAEGKIVIPANRIRNASDNFGIGAGLKTKINVNLGVSKDCCNIDSEWEKVKLAIKLNAESIMDLSCWGKTSDFRRRIITSTNALVGTVPVYDAVGALDKDLSDLTADDFFTVVENHSKEGVDFMTIHAGITLQTVELLEKNNRLLNIVSRGGSLLFSWMKHNQTENPFFEYFDRLLDICRQYDITLSLGDACRPGCLEDASDACQFDEVITLGKLTKRAWERNVQVMIEGPGHVPLHEVASSIQMTKKLCHGAPLYVLGPIVTDIAPGYDHITSAIGGAIAASSGADFLCYVTPAEHLRLPDIHDMKEGIMAAKIAAHSADIAKGVHGAMDKDYKMSSARKNLDWETMFNLSIDKEKPKEYRNVSMPADEHTCTMCGKMCAVNMMNTAIKGKKVVVL